jgi:nucleoside-diphosphate-sugar epimerase
MVLVTGGTGLVGAHLLLLLATTGESVRAIYRKKECIEKTKSLFSLMDKEPLFAKIEWTEGNILEIPSLEIAFENIDFVYHCAGVISFDPNDENLLRKTNIEGTANIVNFCIAKNIKKLCHVSSVAALGNLKEYETVITEETEWNPEEWHSDYAISKYGAEIEIWRGQQEGLEVVVVNPGVILGAGFWNQGSGKFFTAVQKGFPFYTLGTSGYISVFDVVKSMYQLMKSPIHGERFILISENLTFKEVIYSISENLNSLKPNWELKPWMTTIGWRIDWLLSTIFRSKRRLSKYSANSLHSEDFISNDKIKNALNFKFQSIDSVIAEVVSLEKKIII